MRTYKFDQSSFENLYDKEYDWIHRRILSAYKQTTRTVQSKLLKLYEEYISKRGNVLASHVYQYVNYYDLLGEIESELQKFGQLEVSLIETGLKQMYESVQSYLDNAYGFRVGLDHTAEEVAVKSLWTTDGQRFSDRIWRDKGVLMNDLRQGVMDVINGARTPEEVKQELMRDEFNLPVPPTYQQIKQYTQDAFDKAYRSCDRIVRTELTHVFNQSALDKYKSENIERYKYLCAHDERTCPVCSQLDGKIFLVAEAVEGVNIPVIHPNCRCCIAPIV